MELPARTAPAEAPRVGASRVAVSPGVAPTKSQACREPAPRLERVERWNRTLELVGTLAVLLLFFGLALFAG